MHLGHCLAPAFGIYAVRVAVMDNDKVVSRHGGVANFGIRPMYRITVPMLETNLFDFSGDLYGKYLSVELVAWLRPEARFESLDALIAQFEDELARRQRGEDACPARGSFGDLWRGHDVERIRRDIALLRSMAGMSTGPTRH